MTAPAARSLALIGPGRAGCTVAAALVGVGWRVAGVAGRDVAAASVREAADRFGAPARSVADAVEGAGLVIVATPDRAIAAVAVELASVVESATLVIHLAGSIGLHVFGELSCRVGALHPLQTMPEPSPGLARRGGGLVGSWCAVAGDPEVEAIGRELGMIPFPLAEADRARYHAAACIASNHLTALLASVEECAPIPLAAFLPIVRAAVENTGLLGPARALTGPVSRGDAETVRAHLAAIPAGERAAYVALARRAAVLSGRNPDLDGLLA